METIAVLLTLIFILGIIACIILFVASLLKKNFKFTRKNILIAFIVCIIGFILSMCLFSKFETQETKNRVEANNIKKAELQKEKEEENLRKQQDKEKEENLRNQQDKETEEDSESSGSYHQIDEKSEEESESSEAIEEVEKEESQDEKQDEVAIPEVQRSNIIGKSDKSINDISGTILFDEKVRNDVTGKWRLTRIADTIEVQEYALDYYKQKFKNDSEMHGIVNFTLNTTTGISVSGDHLDVTIHEYVNKEEHDAKKLFSGQVLKEYWVYIDNGDIEEIR